MSDQGERGVRWTTTSDDSADHAPEDAPTGPSPQVNWGGQDGGPGAAAGPGRPAPRTALPEVEVPAPEGRTEFSEPEFSEPGYPEYRVPDFETSENRPANGVSWFAAEAPAPEAPEAPEVRAPEVRAPEVRAPEVRAPEVRAPEAPTPQVPDDDWRPAVKPPPAPAEEDVRVAPAPGGPPQEPGPAWEGSLFDGPGGTGDSSYAPVMPSGPSTPPKPGKPSSGNWRMPEWINDEDDARDADVPKGAKAPKPPKPPKPTGFGEDGGRSRLPLFAGVGLLVVALLAAAGVYFMKKGGDSKPDTPPAKQGQAAANTSEEPTPQTQLPPDKVLPKFKGKPSRVVGRIKDGHSGLSFPRFGAPWQLPTKKNKLGTQGWSGQQIVVTEHKPGQIWYGQLLTGTLHPTLMDAYQGPESVKNVTAMAAEGLLQQYYAFPHKQRPLGSQALDVGGHKGWLISSYLSYKRPGVKATGEVVTVAVIDTGAEVPAVVFASVPGTHRRLWPDINAFFGQLKTIS